MSDRISERILEAERIAQRKRYYPPVEKVDWLRTRCPSCGYNIEYEPKDEFKGNLRCPQCGVIFHVTRLDEFFNVCEKHPGE